MTSRRGPSRRSLLLGVLAAPLATRAQATTAPVEVTAELADARLQGAGRLSVFGLHVYDARLWVEPGFAAAQFAQQALALELVYARTLYGRLIAERSLEEMRRFGAIAEPQAARWLSAMRETFPDVARGDRITGLHLPGQGARFFVNGALRGDVRDADFARRFFSIWLAPQTSEPALREALLGSPGARP
jgi:hypothetical protein